MNVEPLQQLELLRKIMVSSDDGQYLNFNVFKLEKIIKEKIPQILRNNAPANFPELYFEFEYVYSKFYDFLLFNELIGKKVVALGGGFSSGKSTFLNSLLGNAKILPTAINPSTSVPTYVIRNDTESAKAINAFSAKVELNIGDVRAIAHGFGEDEDSKELTLGHLIRSIFVSTPQAQYENIAFLDTPGYSKADSDSYSAKTDEKIAHSQLNSSDYIIWFVSADAGTISVDDVNFLANLDKNIPKLVIINKIDKVPNQNTIRDLKEDIKSALNVKGIKYDDVLTYSRKSNVDCDRAAIQECLKNLNVGKQENDFSYQFKKLFVACRKYYDEKIKLKEKQLSILNTSLAFVGSYPEVNDGLTDMQLDIKDNLKELKNLRDNLNGLKDEFFGEIKKIADSVKIKMPEPSEIDLIAEDISNPAEILKKLLLKQNCKRNADLIISKFKRINLSWQFKNLQSSSSELPTINKLIQCARSKTLDNHALEDVEDNFLKRAYLVLLMSIARVNSTKSASLLYPCQIALTCNQESNLEEYMKESLTLSEKEFTDYARVLSNPNIRGIFIFDALLMVCIHDIGNEEKLSYITALSVLINISQAELSEIILLTKSIFQCEDIIEVHFIHAYTARFIPALQKSGNNLFFSSPDSFICSYQNQIDMTEKFINSYCQNSEFLLKDKKIVIMQNLYFHGKIIYFKFYDIEKLLFKNCKFDGMMNDRINPREVSVSSILKPYNCFNDHMHLMWLFSISRVIFDSCVFSNFFLNYHLKTYSHQYRCTIQPSGIIGVVSNSFVEFYKTVFSNINYCVSFYWNTSGNYDSFKDRYGDREVLFHSKNNADFYVEDCLQQNSCPMLLSDYKED